MPKLLVSVRSVSEAVAAIEGGADIIDIKEPDRGSLGRADDQIVQEIARAIAGVRPLSMAGGELLENNSPFPPFSGLIKVGLAGCRFRSDWQNRLITLDGNIVPVAYADWERVEAPRPEKVLEFAILERCPALAIDTWGKDGCGLLDEYSLDALEALCQTADEAGLGIALAGSLTLATIAQVLPLNPEIVAVRSAACRGASRSGEIDRDAVRRLAVLVHGAGSPKARKFTI